MNRKAVRSQTIKNMRRFMKKSIFVVAATLGMMIGTGVCAQNTQQQSSWRSVRPTG